MYQFVISPLYGLCNKLRAIVTTKLISDYCRRTYYITEWLETPTKPGFDSVYVVNNEFKIMPHLPTNHIKVDLNQTNCINLSAIQSESCIFVKTFNEITICNPPKIFTPTDIKNVFAKLKLKTEVIARIPKLPINTIGLHIRRLNEHPSMKFCTMDKITQIIQSHPKTPFFLATEDQTLETTLKDKFKSQIITQNKQQYSTESRYYSGTKRKYQTPMAIDWGMYTDNNDTTHSKNVLYESMVESVVDLYCLAQTQKIYGSYGSSYSKWSSYINNTPLIIIQ